MAAEDISLSKSRMPGGKGSEPFPEQNFGIFERFFWVSSSKIAWMAELSS